ncbi:MAG: P-loop NTPase [Candidatus Bathyarchaeia archaeon]
MNSRLSGVDRIIAVVSGKGGVGKSLIATTMALLLARDKFRVGLFDVDFTSPTTHVVLNAGGLKPIEEKGIVPPEVYGLKYMSLAFYLGGRALPLRGQELTNILLETLAYTIWGKLDALIVDMPPGISDLMLDMLKYVRRAEYLIVTTPSKMAFETVRKLIMLLKDLGAPVLGVIENMRFSDTEHIKREVETLGERYLGGIGYDMRLEESLGRLDNLLNTRFAAEVGAILRKIVYLKT